MICITVDVNNTLVYSGNPPCSESSLVALTLSEFQVETASPWRLTLAEGSLIAAAIVFTWGLGFSLRALRSALNSADAD